MGKISDGTYGGLPITYVIERENGIMETFNFTYATPYLALFLVFVALLFWEFRQINDEIDTKYIRWISIILFLFFFGLRGFIYTDWAIYYPLFDKLPTIGEGGLTKVLSTDFSEEFITDVSVGKAGMELGFIYFTVFFKSLINNYFAFVFVNTLIDVILLNVFLKRYSRYYALSIILFMVFGGYILEFNLMRNIKAIMLFLISIKYIQERRILPYLLLNTLGFFFHSSALIFFPLYFILNKQWPQWLIWGIFIVGNMIFLLHIKYLETTVISIADLVGGRMGVKARLYFASDFYSQSYGIGLGYIERVITFLVMILTQNKLKEQSPHNQIFINCFILYFVVYFFFSEIMVAVERISLLFVFSYWILYPEILFMLKETMHKWILLVLICMYSTLKIIQANTNIYSRYDNLLFGIESFEDRSTKMYNNYDLLFKQE